MSPVGGAGMRRRDFLGVVSGAVVAGPIAVRAQQSERVRSDCCARTAIGPATTAPLTTPRKSRRLMPAPPTGDILTAPIGNSEGAKRSFGHKII